MLLKSHVATRGGARLRFCAKGASLSFFLHLEAQKLNFKSVAIGRYLRATKFGVGEMNILSHVHGAKLDSNTAAVSSTSFKG